MPHKKTKEKITTTVTKKASVIDGIVKNFLSNADIATALDIEQTLILDSSNSTGVNQWSKITILALYDSKECLIVQLSRLDYIPRQLLNFLNLPNFTFAGIGIKESVAKLERDYCIGCKNAVELGALAADLNSCCCCLVGCGIDELAYEIDKSILERPMSSVFDDWGAEFLNDLHIKFATYHRIGSKLDIW